MRPSIVCKTEVERPQEGVMTRRVFLNHLQTSRL